jgi:putative SOS response-associated peptidase YedK
MCGRYTLTRELEVLQPRFRFSGGAIEMHPRYNVAPTQDAPVVIGRPSRILRMMRWGLIPHWARDKDIGNRLINARAETLAEKPSFRTPLQRGRCLVLADGFYEWKKATSGGRKVPMRITLKDGEPFAFAALWDTWKSPDDEEEIESFTIVTTEANELMRDIHDRMPVILPEEEEDRWLSAEADVRNLLTVLKPFPAGRMRAYEVSTLVNRARYDDPICIVPIAGGEAAGRRGRRVSQQSPDTPP